MKSSSGASHVAKYTSTEHATREMKTGEEKRLSLEQSHLGIGAQWCNVGLLSFERGAAHMAKAPQLKNQFLRYWYERRHDTARFVQACYDEAPTMSAAKLHALCRLTWCNLAKKKTKFDVAETTGSLVAPALEELFGKTIEANSLEDLAISLDEAGIPKVVRHAAGKKIGFVSFYNAYRNTSKQWLKTHEKAVLELFAHARQLKSDAARRKLYERIATLPDIPRKKGGSLPAANLLTPVIACLDPQVRCPIINSAPIVVERLTVLGRLHATLPKQFDGLVALVGKPGVPDAFVLELTDAKKSVYDPESKEQALFEAEERLFEPAVPRSESLPIKNEEDIKVVSDALRTKHKQLHNRMTNRLLAVCQQKMLTVEEGRPPNCRFDALVRNHPKGHDLLIEVKSTTEIADVRLAVGQLLDYRRQLPKKATTNIAVLLPNEPGEHVRAFLADVKARALWFKKDLKTIQGF